jgi:hypothetical protein
MWCSSQLRQILESPFTIGAVVVRSVRNLGIFMDPDASMRTHVTKTISCCFSALRLTWCRWSLPDWNMEARHLLVYQIGNSTDSSLCSMRPRDWCAGSTGCRFRSESHFVWPPSPIGVCTDWRRHIFRMSFTESPTPPLVSGCGLHRQRRHTFHRLSILLSVIECSRMPPRGVSSTSSPSAFTRLLKTHLFRKRYGVT